LRIAGGLSPIGRGHRDLYLLSLVDYLALRRRRESALRQER